MASEKIIITLKYKKIKHFHFILLIILQECTVMITNNTTTIMTQIKTKMKMNNKNMSNNTNNIMMK